MALFTSSLSHGTPRSSSPIVHTAVTIDDTFWGPRIQAVREQTLPIMYEQMKKAGYFDANQRGWHKGMQPIPYVFWESDITKWLEAASFSLATHPDPQLEAMVDAAIAFVASLQQPDGYLNLWFTEVEPERRLTNLRDLHELYCAGHLIEAAVAHFYATGKRSLLDPVCRYADYINSVFGREEGKRRGYDGHEEVELALIKLYHATGEERYLQLSHYFIEERGQQPHYFDAEAQRRGEDPARFWARSYEYNQSHQPVRQQLKVVGHSVRDMYLLSAVADLARELSDTGLRETGERLWQDLVSTRLYITGGIGSSKDNEGFTSDYDLPNLHAYAETCAAIGLILWNHRLLQLDADGRYADLLERSLYNGVLSGISQDGTTFFYVNPLESKGTHHRRGWYNCACCPPNIARLFASLGQYIYGVNDTDLLIHLYIQGETTCTIAGQSIKVRQETRYPWDGDVRITLDPAEPAEFGLNLRIPGWCKTARLTINGEDVALAELVVKGYARIVRQWQAGDEALLHLDMPVEQVYANPAVQEDAGSVALQRGPLVYCIEAADNPLPLHLLSVPENASFTSHFEPDLLGGSVVVQGDASALSTDDWTDTLYRTTAPAQTTRPITAIPYYAWDNREPGEMRVWICKGR